MRGTLQKPLWSRVTFPETLEEVAQRGGRRPIPGDVLGQLGRGSEQPGLVEDVPAHCRGVGPDGPLKVPSHPNHPVIP